jgi:subtilisin family serine protease
MPSRLTSTVSTTLLLLAAATAPAVEELSIDDGRNQMTARLADDELQVDEPVARQPGTRNRPMRQRAVRTGLARGREALTRQAGDLLASGTATRASLVAYLNGRMGDPSARAVVSRRLHIRVAQPADIAAVAAQYRLRLVSPEPGDIRGAVVEPLDDSLFAPLDAHAALRRDARVAMANPLLELPMESRYDPNDPIFDPPPYPTVGPPAPLPNVEDTYPNPPGYAWHLSDTFPPAAGPVGVRVRGVWDRFKGEGQNIAITDCGLELTHEDLLQNARSDLSYDYFANDPYPLPDLPAEIHATFLAGLAAARGDNGIGTVGVAYRSGIVSSRIFPGAPNATATPDDRLGRALSVGSISTSAADLVHVNLNAWGPLSNGRTILVPGALTIQGLKQGVSSGRLGRGTVFVWAAGNGGWDNPDGTRPDGVHDTAAFDNFLNRFTIPVAAITDGDVNFFPQTPGPRGVKTAYSEPGPNLIISAPGGAYYLTNPTPGAGMVSTDRSDTYIPPPNEQFVANGYVNNFYPANPPNADFNGDNVISNTPENWWTPAGPGQDLYDVTPPITPDSQPSSSWRPYENGAYVPADSLVRGTSNAAALVAGAAALMVQARPQLSWRDVRALMAHRGQDRLPPPWNWTGELGLWDDWISNDSGLLYNNFYGFGAVDIGRFVYGGGGAAADTVAAAGLAEPGALRWPLYPPLLNEPLVYEVEFPLPDSTATTDPTAIYDAPPYNPFDLVPDGRPQVGVDSRIRAVPLPLDRTSIPPRFRIDSVELEVRLDDVGPQSYGSPQSVAMDEVGDVPGFLPGQYHWWLTSPNGTQAILGRQRPGPNRLNQGVGWQHTFTEFFHMNELLDPANPNPWVLSVIDQVNDANPNPAPPTTGIEPTQARISKVKLVIHGHQTYGIPRISSLPTNGVASGEGNQTLLINGSEFAVTQGGLPATQAYWDPANFTNPGNAGAVELSTGVTNTGRISVQIPSALLPTTAPGRAFLRVANPAIIVGRTTGTPPVDLYDTPNELYPTPRADDPERYMKECPDTDIQSIRYSRRPILSPIPDIRLENGGSFTISALASDPDVIAGLQQAPPAVGPETLTVSVLSRNQIFVPQGNIVLTSSPGGNGVGTYQWTVTTNGSASAFALIEVSATDGVTTTTRAFRVIIPSKEDGSGCGGGMGLALLGVPLGFWLLRRRKRDEKN